MPELSLLPVTRFAVAPFARWTYSDAEQALKNKLPANYQVCKDYVIHKDHFRKGEEWVGPGDKSDTKIAAQFAPEDVTGEVLSNVSNAFSEPQIGVVPLVPPAEGQTIPSETQRKIDDLRELIANWWDHNRLQEIVQDRQEVAAWAGFAALRLWIPHRFLNKQGTTLKIRDADTVEKALSYIYVSHPLPESCGVYVDPSTQDRCAIYLDEITERDSNGNTTTIKRAELVYLDPARETDDESPTIVRIVYSDPQRPAVEARLELGGRSLVSEMVTRKLITDPVLRTHRQLNLLCSLITRIGETAAFRERYIMNAKPYGIKVEYNEGDTIPVGGFLEMDETGREWLVIPQERTLGASTTTELVGLPKHDELGKAKENVTPSVQLADPVDPKPYIEAADAARRRILRMCSQGHLGGISNAEASGIAYEQARAVFEKDLNKRRVAEEGMLRDELTATVALAEEISGQEGYFTDVVRITVDQRIDAGPRSPDHVRLDHEGYEAGLLGRETAMARIGVEDVNAELLRVRREATHILEVLDKAQGLLDYFTPESVKAALKQLNIPQEIINALVPKPEPEPPAPAPTGGNVE